MLLSGCASNTSAIAAGNCTLVQHEHGVSFAEIAKLFAMAYSWNGNSSYLRASVNAFDMAAQYDVQVLLLLLLLLVLVLVPLVLVLVLVLLVLVLLVLVLLLV